MGSVWEAWVIAFPLCSQEVSMAPSPGLATSVNGDIVWESLSPASLRGVEVGEGKWPCEWLLALRRGTVSPIPSSTLGKWGDVEGLSWDGTVWGLHLGLLIPGEGQPGDTNHFSGFSPNLSQSINSPLY